MESPSSVTDGCHLYILLLEPKQKKYELAHIICPSREPKVDEILPILAINIKEPIFRTQQHIGLCRLQDKKPVSNTDIITARDGDRKEEHFGNGDLLVAVPHGYTEEYCKLIGGIILQNNPVMSKKIDKHRQKMKKLRTKRKSRTKSISNGRILSSPKGVDSHPVNSSHSSCGSSNIDSDTSSPYLRTYPTLSFRSSGDNSNVASDTSDQFFQPRQVYSFPSPSSSIALDSSIKFPQRKNSISTVQSENTTHAFSKIRNLDDSQLHNTPVRYQKEKRVDISKLILIIVVMLGIPHKGSEKVDNNSNISNTTRSIPFDFYGIIRVFLFGLLLVELQRNWSTIRKMLYAYSKGKRPLHRSRLTNQQRKNA